jgi:hypothetical protein
MIRTKRFIWIVMALLVITASYSVAGAAEHSGVVLETVTGGGYTYMHIEEGGKKFWIAGPQTSISKGAKVGFSEQIWMSNFESKALGRTFDKLLFVSGVQVASSAPGPSKVASSKGSKSNKVAGTYTVEELYAKKDELNGSIVKLRGNVVKVSSGILGRTWVHIKDSTDHDGNNKIVFTSRTDSSVVGAVVTAQGRLETDKDFGAGYFYPVIVEDSTFSK